MRSAVEEDESVGVWHFEYRVQEFLCTECNEINAENCDRGGERRLASFARRSALVLRGILAAYRWGRASEGALSYAFRRVFRGSSKARFQ